MTTLYLAAMDALYKACLLARSATARFVHSLYMQHAFMHCRRTRSHAHAQVSPTTLILVEGCGQLGSSAAMNWQGYTSPLSSSAAVHTCCMEYVAASRPDATCREACHLLSELLDSLCCHVGSSTLSRHVRGQGQPLWLGYHCLSGRACLQQLLFACNC